MKKVQSHTSKDEIPESELVLSLLDTIEDLRKENEKLRQEREELISTIKEFKALIVELNARLKENSQNSSLPPSRDLYPPVNKDRSLREKKNRSVGGQKGHKGKTRELSDNPDEIHVLHIDTCTCGHDLRDVEPIRERERRQIIEIPIAPCHITEYQGEVKRCPVCGKILRSTFPDEVPYRINFGENMKAYTIYAKDELFASYEKIGKMLQTFHDIRISPATISSFINNAGNTLIPFEERVKDALVNANVVNFDETGCKILGKKNWVHVACTPQLTILYPHAKRGSTAMNDMGILPNFHGYAVHDCWPSYNQFPCKHVLCNAHLIREERGVYQNYPGNLWAHDFEMLFWNAHKYLSDGNKPSLTYLTRLSREYDSLVEIGFKCNPPPEIINKRGRRKNTKPRNLLIRLRNYKEGILSFFVNPEIPFTNNQAERDLRPIKTQQKISGTFRSERGAISHFRIAGFIQTLKKNNQNVYEGLRLLSAGTPPSLSDILRGAE